MSSPGGLATSSATSIEEGSFCLTLDPPMNIRVGAITLSRVGSIAETEYNLVSPADSTSTWLWYAGITSPTNGIDFSLFTSTVFNVIFDGAGAPTPNIPQQVKYFSEVNFMLPLVCKLCFRLHAFEYSCYSIVSILTVSSHLPSYCRLKKVCHQKVQHLHYFY